MRIDPNLEKVSAITKMMPPGSLHDVHKLTGCMAPLSRFISRLNIRAPFFQTPKKIGQVLVDSGGTGGLRRLEEVSDYYTHPDGPRTS
jgi:hypothetical protein